LQDALRALNGAAPVQHVFCHVVGTKDGAVFVGQCNGTAERIEGFSHPLAHDGADIEHFADRHRPPQMREQRFVKPEDAEAFAERFGGELCPRRDNEKNRRVTGDSSQVAPSTSAHHYGFC
jgi:hypothetical protein